MSKGKKRFKARDIKNGLKRKGFSKEETTHHEKYVYYVDGKKAPVYTYLSRGANEISFKLLKEMAKQLGLDYDDFVDLIECPLKEEEYIKILKLKGIL